MIRSVLVVIAIAATARADGEKLSALVARTPAVAKEVAKIRGLPLKREIPNEVIDHAALRASLDKLAADPETATATAAEGLALRRWGMIPLDDDYAKQAIDLLTDQIAGFYDAETKKLTILDSAGDDAQWAELVLAHELDHGLQDQTFDLKAFEKLPDTEGDASAARAALVEGDGVALMIEVMLARAGHPAPWGNPEIAAEMVNAMTVPRGDTLGAAPLAVREAMIFPYREGFAFVAALRRRKPWSAIDAAFRRPPKSTEQIIHPDKYLADELPIEIAAVAPPSLTGFSIAQSTVWGELGFQLFLRSHGVAERVAVEAAAGWGGDRAIVLTRGGDRRPEHAVGLVHSEWDTEADAREAQVAIERALDDAVLGGTVEQTPTKTRWLALDGTVSWVERRGTAVMFAIGVPPWASDALATEAWVALPVVVAKKSAHASR